MHYKKIPFVGFGAYGAEFPNSSFLSGSDQVNPPTTVVMRADTTKAPGVPGLIAWLAESQPKVYNAAFAYMPHNVRIAMNKLKTGASKLSGANAQAAYLAQFNRSTDKTQSSLYPTASLRGMGDTSLAQDIAASTQDAGNIAVNFDSGSVSDPQSVAIASTGETSGTPTLTPTGTSQLIASIAQAGQAIITGVDQQTIFNTQLARAKAGLPPLNTSAYFTNAGSAINSYLPYIAGGGLLLFLLSRRKRA